MELKTLTEKYLIYCELQKGLNPKTIKSYRIDLSQFKLVAEKPKNAEFGDFSVNVSSLAKVFRKAPAQIAQDIISIAGAIKTAHREENVEQPISIGLDRVLGLYQSGNMRRWYDKYPYLNQAILTISTLPEEDYLNIMEGLCDSLSATQGLH